MNFLLNSIFVTLALLLSVSVNQCFADGESRIVGGTIVENINTARHQVSIQLIGVGHICGGVLIENNTVLTAAHCVMGPRGSVRSSSEFNIIAGILHLTGSNPGTQFFTIVDSIKVHENYNSATFENDLAIIKLNREIYNDIGTYPVNLRTVPVKVGTICQVTGWGHLSYLATTESNDLRTEDITVYDSAYCNSAPAPGMLCIGNVAGACTGDSGGPVICDNLLTGIVSFGKECALDDFPGVYTDIEYHKRWISLNHGNNLKNNFLVLTVFCFFSIFYFK